MKNINFQVSEFQVPVVRFNLEETKEQLNQLLLDYKDLVVTEDTLPGCKAAQKELARLRKQIDRTRIDKKKELEIPIKNMEAQCKELVAMIEEVEKPIKEGIDYYNNLRKEEKAKFAEEYIGEVVNAYCLKEKYAKQLTVLDKYKNLTAKPKDVEADIDSRAFVLVAEQKREEESMEILQQSFNMENERLKTKMEFSRFEELLDRGYNTSEILLEIKKQAELIYKAENAPVAPQKEEPANPEQVMAEPPKAAQKPDVAVWTVTLDITGTTDEIRALADFLKCYGYQYKKVAQYRR